MLKHLFSLSYFCVLTPRLGFFIYVCTIFPSWVLCLLARTHDFYICSDAKGKNDVRCNCVGNITSV